MVGGARQISDEIDRIINPAPGLNVNGCEKCLNQRGGEEYPLDCAGMFSVKTSGSFYSLLPKLPLFFRSG